MGGKSVARIAPALLLASCFAISHEYDGPREITPGTKLSRESEEIGRVSGSRKAQFLFWGIVPLNTVSAPELLESLAAGSHGDAFDGVTEVRIHEKQEAVDVIVEILTLGIFSMITVETEGEVQRFADGGGQ